MLVFQGFLRQQGNVGWGDPVLLGDIAVLVLLADHLVDDGNLLRRRQLTLGSASFPLVNWRWLNEGSYWRQILYLACMGASGTDLLGQGVDLLHVFSFH